MEVAKLLVSTEFDNASVNKMAQALKSQLENVEKGAAKITITPDNKATVNEFKKVIGDIKNLLETQFKNVNLNGLMDGVLNSMTKSVSVKNWLTESQKVANTLKVL